MYFHDNKLYNYVKHPFGSQNKPDFLININNPFIGKIQLECKSSKTPKPVWNCSLSEKNIIYIFYSFHKKYNKFCVFNSESVIDDKQTLALKKFADKIKHVCNEFNKEFSLNFSFYCRNMYNQHIELDFSNKNLNIDWVLHTMYSL
jgi:hypothetical protein